MAVFLHYGEAIGAGGAERFMGILLARVHAGVRACVAVVRRPHRRRRRGPPLPSVSIGVPGSK